MKKILKLSVVMLLALVLVGCGAKEDKVLKCTLKQNDVVNGYSAESIYEITTDGKIVKNVVSTEIVTSSDESILKTFETTLKNSYGKMNETYGGYDNNIKIENGKLTSVTKIDYTKLDIKKLVEDQPTMKNATNSSNQLTLEGIQAIYKALGATCE